MDIVLNNELDWAETVSDHLHHLPEKKKVELVRVVKILSDEFELALRGKTSPKNMGGRILKLILFGSYARGDWVEDIKSGYRSDYDLLVVVNTHTFTDLEYWYRAQEHFTREIVLSRQLKTPVNFIVHSIEDVNDQLSRGRPFFVDVIRDGIVLYEDGDHPLAEPKPLTAGARKAEAQSNFEQYWRLTNDAMRMAEIGLAEDIWRDGAFMLHQATERAYNCILLTLKLYSPKSHNIKNLRRRAEEIEPRLVEAWPRDNRFSRRCFEQLERAYVEARYSPKFEIKQEEIDWLVERIKVLQGLVETICRERLSE